MTEKTGTLAELNVKPGDVVEWISNGRLHTIITSEKITEDKWRGEIRANLSEYGFGIFGDEMFRLVSRATLKTWGEMTDTEKGAILLADHRGEVIEVLDNDYDDADRGYWLPFFIGDLSDDLIVRVRPPEPKRETTTLFWHFDEFEEDRNYFTSRMSYSTHRITFDVIDGKPDCESIRMEEM